MNGEEFARYLLDKHDKKGQRFDDMQVQKLTYICHGFFLAGDIDLITETPRAWLYGPIYPTMAHWFAVNPAVIDSPPKCKPTIIDEIEKKGGIGVIDSVLEKFADWTGAKLSAWTHEPGSPWAHAMLKTGKLDSPLDLNRIKDYFRAMQ